MQCEKCGRRTRNPRPSCMYCGGAIIAEAASTGPICCSACGTQMEAQEYEGVVIDVCPRCESIWFDNGELDVFIQKRIQLNPDESPPTELDQPTSAVPQGGGRYRKCPHCSNLMNQQNYKRMSGVIIDICRQHGVFLDNGELENIQQFIAVGGEQRFQERMLQEQTEAIRNARLKKLRNLLRPTRYSSS